MSESLARRAILALIFCCLFAASGWALIMGAPDSSGADRRPLHDGRYSVKVGRPF
jgi:hypothetical protein